MIGLVEYTLVPASSNLVSRASKETECQRYGAHLLALETFGELTALSAALLSQNYPHNYQLDVAAQDTTGTDDVHWTLTNTPMNYGIMNGLALANVDHGDGDCVVLAQNNALILLRMSHCNGHATDFLCERPA